MIDLRQTWLHQGMGSGDFLWATGIEDTFITSPHPTTGRTLDEYELTAHYQRYDEDLALMRDLGVNSARYGIPWHRINPQREEWHWEWADRPLERLLESGITPIVDLVHYGLPAWIEGAYSHPDFPRYMAEYASRVAERFRGRIHAYTPLNEPRITAWYCGYLGWWPPFRRGWRGFVEVMLAACRGIVETVHALRTVDPAIVPYHVDATDLYTCSDPAHTALVEQRQEIVFLALDLVSGRVTPGHRLWAWLRGLGVSEPHLLWFHAHAIELPVIGLNLYPMFTRKDLRVGARGRLRWHMPYAGGELVDQLGLLYWRRYRAPLWISETASVGAVARRARWLRDSLAAVRRLREGGVPLLGYTWWPLFALVTWAYRQGKRPPGAYLKQMGLWNLSPALERIRTPLVDAYREAITHSTASVGTLPLAPRATATNERTSAPLR